MNSEKLLVTSSSIDIPLETNDEQQGQRRNSQHFTSHMTILQSELKNHINASKKQHLNDTVNEILTNIQNEDKKHIEIINTRKSFLDKFSDDIFHDISPKKIKIVKNNKKFRATVSLTQLEKRSVASLESAFNPNSSIIHMNTSMKGNIKYMNSYKPMVSTVTSLTGNDLNRDFYEKEKIRMQKKQNKIEQLRTIKLKQEKERAQEKPQLTKNTKEIIEKKINNNTPLYLRTQEVLEKKNNYMEGLKRIYLNDKIEPTVEGNKKFSREKMENFVTQQLKWGQGKEERMDRLKTEIKKTQPDEEKPNFIPNINKTSEILVTLKTQQEVDENGINYFHKPAHERLYNGYITQVNRINKLFMDSTYSFSPNINKKEPKYLKTKPSFLNRSPEKGSYTLTNCNLNDDNNNSDFNNFKNLKDDNANLKNKFNKANTQKTKQLNHSAFNIEPKVPDFKISYNNNLKIKNDQKENIEKSINDNLTDGLYKLNVREGSAWNNKENSIIMNKDSKFSYMLSKVMK